MGLEAASSEGFAIRRIVALIIAFLSLAIAAPASAAPHVSPSLAFETLEPASGSTVRVAVVLDAPSGWHTYWTNPGEVGAPPRVSWEAPGGFSFSRPRHPAPKLLAVQGIASYVHEGRHALLLTMKVPAGLAQGTPLPVSAKLEWLACSESQCVPEKAELEQVLVVGMGSTDYPGLAAIRKAEASLPEGMRAGSFYVTDGAMSFVLPGRHPDASLFPSSGGWFEAGARQSVSVAAGTTTVTVSSAGGIPKGQFSGLVVAGANAWTFDASRSPAPASTRLSETAVVATGSSRVSVSDTAPSAPVAKGRVDVAGERRGMVSSQAARLADMRRMDGSGEIGLLPILFASLLGGLLLNLMPCVFPILSLKALALARAGADEKTARADGIGYAFGATAATGGLGIVLVAMKMAGISAGWSFQLQNPAFVFILSLMLLMIGLNLAGVFEIVLPFGFSGRQREGLAGGAASGALAAFVATPCSGPFMAGALGAAMLLPPLGGIMVFAGLGLGMSLPFLALAFIPGLRRMMPKPGPWMVGFRRLLAVPMLASAAWLLWVVRGQIDDGSFLVVVVGTIVVLLSLVLAGRSQRIGRPMFPLLAVAGLAVVAVPASGLERSASASVELPRDAGVRPFSRAELERLVAGGTPVFVDFTARWCLTCKVNERTAIATERTRSAFAREGVVTLVADWTDGDPEITRFLAEHGRNSIPFYLLYDRTGRARILPQILTPALLEESAAAL